MPIIAQMRSPKLLEWLSITGEGIFLPATSIFKLVNFNKIASKWLNCCCYGSPRSKCSPAQLRSADSMNGCMCEIWARPGPVLPRTSGTFPISEKYKTCCEIVCKVISPKWHGKWIPKIYNKKINVHVTKGASRSECFYFEIWSRKCSMLFLWRAGMQNKIEKLPKWR